MPGLVPDQKTTGSPTNCGKPWVMPTLLGLLLAVPAAYWGYCRVDASESAHAVHAKSSLLGSCVFRQSAPRTAPAAAAALTRRLMLSRAETRPLSVCLAELQALDTALEQHQRIHFHRAPAAVDTLARALRELREIDLGAVATDLNESKSLTRLAHVMHSVLDQACTIAHAEGVFSSVPCPSTILTPLRFRPATGRLLVNAMTATDSHWDVAVYGNSRAKLSITLRNPDGKIYATLLSTKDEGQSWAQVSLPPTHHDTQAPLPMIHGQEAVTLLPWKANGRTGADLFRIDWEKSAVEKFAELPPSTDLATGGSWLMATAEHAVLATQAAREQRPGQLWYHPLEKGSNWQQRAAPEGRLVGAFAYPQPALAIVRPGRFVRIVKQPLVGPDDPWPASTEVDVAHTPELRFARASEQYCGTPSEAFFPMVARQPASEKAVLAVFSKKDVYPYRFKASPKAAIHPICGPCLPAALETSRPLRLHLPVRRKLAASEISTSTALTRDGVSTAHATCSASSFVLAYRVGNHLLTQRSESIGRTFSSPTILAEGNRHGDPLRVRLLGFGERVVAIWQRRKGSAGLRLEYAISRDGGTTWE